MSIPCTGASTRRSTATIIVYRQCVPDYWPVATFNPQIYWTIAIRDVLLPGGEIEANQERDGDGDGDGALCKIFNGR